MSTAPNPHSQVVSKQRLLLLLLGLDGSSISKKGIGGITRLQKLLFLLWKEAGVREVESGFEFVPFKAGPYSQKLYDELELLENLGLVQSEVQGEATEAEAAELEELSFEQLMGDDAHPFHDVASRSELEQAKITSAVSLDGDAFQEAVRGFLDGESPDFDRYWQAFNLRSTIKGHWNAIRTITGFAVRATRSTAVISASRADSSVTKKYGANTASGLPLPTNVAINSSSESISSIRLSWYANHPAPLLNSFLKTQNSKHPYRRPPFAL